ncbi:MAG: hypothetical protein QNJ68_21720 [Microcoleaceae cyanobacterium MO_207.B10]|nr:hypothetical protein [Microcoleaceae cyanobacterium MO_207.B10]
MGKQFSLSFNVKDDNTVEVESIKVKLEAPKKPTAKKPPGQDFVTLLLLIFLGIWLIVNFLVPRGQITINEQQNAPTNSENNPTTKLPSNSEELEM